eukprot:CAMPEP_0176313160 /NCGR_PEP_ID=MMETSP0121_2-20121125/67033_1 /TAXON_ID=160619 /ORGANISM="Kryptoperidinium foliaceum, Strain CCMP 1326" /LENGTH=53 /DNA_ID=CAMNT_0017655249 /DNA_START=35 /DNA_END=192 /DNA_ORIENTATION=+
MAHQEDIEALIEAKPAPPARRRWAAPLGAIVVAMAGAAGVAVAVSLALSRGGA